LADKPMVWSYHLRDYDWTEQFVKIDFKINIYY